MKNCTKIDFRDTNFEKNIEIHPHNFTDNDSPVPLWSVERGDRRQLFKGFRISQNTYLYLVRHSQNPWHKFRQIKKQIVFKSFGIT